MARKTMGEGRLGRTYEEGGLAEDGSRRSVDWEIRGKKRIR